MAFFPDLQLPRRTEAPYSWSEERRSFPRWPVALEGSCYGAWGSSKCLISELSEGGITVVSGHFTRVGEEFTVAWRLSDIETPLHITCQVRQISDRQVGLKFLDASHSDLVRIRQYVRQRLRTDNA